MCEINCELMSRDIEPVEHVQDDSAVQCLTHLHVLHMKAGLQRYMEL